MGTLLIVLAIGLAVWAYFSKRDAANATARLLTWQEFLVRVDRKDFVNCDLIYQSGTSTRRGLIQAIERDQSQVYVQMAWMAETSPTGWRECLPEKPFFFDTKNANRPLQTALGIEITIKRPGEYTFLTPGDNLKRTQVQQV